MDEKALPLARLCILVVDDNANMRRLVRTLLVGFGCGRVFEAADGAEAFEVIEHHEIDIAIIDYLMEPMDGVDIVRMIRDTSGGAQFLPVIMMTGSANRGVVARARDAGITEFLAKPLSAKTLWMRLRAVINRPRPFVRAESFFGPDRRRREVAGYEGPERRELENAEGGRDGQ